MFPLIWRLLLSVACVLLALVCMAAVLPEALSYFICVVDQFKENSGIHATLAGAEFVDPGAPDLSSELLQIVGEAPNNIQKHSGATRVAIALPNSGRALELSIEENGSGFCFAGNYTLEELELLRLRPGSIKSRFRSVGGELQLDSKLRQGVGLKIRVDA